MLGQKRRRRQRFSLVRFFALEYSKTTAAI